MIGRVVDRMERVREALEAWNSGDLAGYLNLVGPHVRFSPDPLFPEQGPFSGEELERYLEQWLETWGGTAELAAEELSERGDAIVVRARWIISGASSGAHVPADFSFVIWLRPDGTFDRLLAFFDHEQALAAADAGRDAAG